MKTKKEQRNNYSELHSEKIRNLINETPSSLAHWGIVTIAIITAVLALIGFLIPYPYGKGETIFQHFFF